MAIVITQARFDTKGRQGVAAEPQDGLDAAGRLVAWIGGTLIASYRTSGDHDVLFIFEADSYDERYVRWAPPPREAAWPT